MISPAAVNASTLWESSVTGNIHPTGNLLSPPNVVTRTLLVLVLLECITIYPPLLVNHLFNARHGIGVSFKGKQMPTKKMVAMNAAVQIMSTSTLGNHQTYRMILTQTKHVSC